MHAPVRGLPYAHARVADDLVHSSFEIMATWRCILLLVLGALVVECTQLDSQYSPTYVVCSGSCCPECLNGLQNPGSCGGRKCFSSHGAEYAIDNNLQTLWNSSAQYSNTTSISIGLTLDLGQVRSLVLYSSGAC